MLALVVACLAAAACATELPAQAGDEKLVIRASDLAAAGVELPPDYRQHEKLYRQPRVTDGEIVVYQLDSEELSILSTAAVYDREGAACENFANLNSRVTRDWVGHEGMSVVGDSAVFDHGEWTRFAQLDAEGKPVGNVFQMCSSRVQLMSLVMGVYYDDPELWQEIVQPVLDALHAYERTAPAK
jgi:hypothetical protein